MLQGDSLIVLRGNSISVVLDLDGIKALILEPYLYRISAIISG
jgi:hypothetical protein